MASTSLVALLLALTASQVHSFSVSVYYESLCPDSRNFILNQLNPTFGQLSQYFQVDFVPYGKANHTLDPWAITCQHGPDECRGNLLQSCVLSRTSDNKKQVQFVNCIMTAFDPASTQECATSANISYDGVEECASGKEGHNLLDVHGNRTHAFRPPITFVPTIAIDDVYDQTIQNQSLTMFKRVVCNLIPAPQPAECKTIKKLRRVLNHKL